jgi:hypothetical protein
MSDDLDGAHSHQHILHNGESYIKLADAAETCKRLRTWHTAVYNALTEWHDPPRDDEAPKDALRRLIQYEITAALDPAVSQSAPDLVATARREGMEGFGDLVAAAHAEATKAMQKYPQPNYVISKIAEEAGEVVKAAIHCAEKRETAENVAGEMKQLIAMLIRLWIEGDQVHGLPPIAAAIRAAAKEEK